MKCNKTNPPIYSVICYVTFFVKIIFNKNIYYNNMKKIFYLIITLLVLFGCSKIENTNDYIYHCYDRIEQIDVNLYIYNDNITIQNEDNELIIYTDDIISELNTLVNTEEDIIHININVDISTRYLLAKKYHYYYGNYSSYEKMFIINKEMIEKTIEYLNK